MDKLVRIDNATFDLLLLWQKATFEQIGVKKSLKVVLAEIVNIHFNKILKEG